MIEVIKADYVSDYKISIEFNNAEKGIIDLTELLWGKAFEQLIEKDEFKRFKIKHRTIFWENGADVAPEYLFDKLVQQTKTAV